MIIIAHKIRGHHVEPFRVLDEKRPWRWQCSCGKVFGGDAPFRHAITTPQLHATVEVVKEVEELSTDIIETVREKAPDEEQLKQMDDEVQRKEQGGRET